jgi:hypothetical protein
MATSDRARQLAALERTPGPSPWYWKTFPGITGASGRRFSWQHHGDQGELAYLVTLALEQETNLPRLALNTFCVPFSISAERFGVWCPEPGAIRVMCFDPDRLATFKYEDIVGWFKPSNDRVYAGTPPLSEFEVNTRLPAGTHKIDVPEEFRSLDEMAIAGSCAAKTKEDAACAIFVLYPQAGLVEVLPQKWFTAADFEVGRQWITRVTRDPDTHRLIGEGVRMGKFELTEDGCGFARWIEKG